MDCSMPPICRLTRLGADDGPRLQKRVHAQGELSRNGGPKSRVDLVLIELFSGIGGGRRALEVLELTPAVFAAAEMDARARSGEIGLAGCGGI